jgi:hypothetical protein
MAVRLNKPWRELARWEELPGHMGVFQLADALGQVIYVGFAGGGSLFGLRGEVAAAAACLPAARSFRVEVTTAYLTRWQELLMVHKADHGLLPSGNDELPGLGRLSPG